MTLRRILHETRVCSAFTRSSAGCLYCTFRPRPPNRAIRCFCRLPHCIVHSTARCNLACPSLHVPSSSKPTALRRRVTSSAHLALARRLCSLLAPFSLAGAYTRQAFPTSPEPLAVFPRPHPQLTRHCPPSPSPPPAHSLPPSFPPPQLSFPPPPPPPHHSPSLTPDTSSYSSSPD